MRTGARFVEDAVLEEDSSGTDTYSDTDHDCHRLCGMHPHDRRIKRALLFTREQTL